MSSTKTLSELTQRVLIEPVNGCWLWTGSIDADGYAQVSRGGRMTVAHRVFYELVVGPIPAGMEIDHLCRKRACVNPSHLEAVTHRINTLRGDTIPARYAARTHCSKGHELSGENLASRSDGARTCRHCIREQKRLRARFYRSTAEGRARANAASRRYRLRKKGIGNADS